MNTTIYIMEQLKCNPLKLKIRHILTILKKLMTEILNLKLVIMSEYQNTKTYLLKGLLQIGLKRFL